MTNIKIDNYGNIDEEIQFNEEEIMRELYEQEASAMAEVEENDERLLQIIEEFSPKGFFQDLMLILDDKENGILHGYVIVDKPKGQFQTENYGSINGIWWTNIPMRLAAIATTDISQLNC